MLRGVIRVLGAAGVAAALLAAAPARAQYDDSAPKLLAGRTLMGQPYDLAQLRGHVVIVHFWATWCPPCIREMPVLEAFYNRYQPRGVEVLALSEDRTRDVAQVHQLMHHGAMSYPVGMAHEATVNSFGDPSALPVTFGVDGQGIVRARLRPDAQELTLEGLAKIVDPLLAAAP
jgi:cytochrome c biogenesis protein CcmG, thiol:disulfide interchange protein DsbE